MLHALRENEIVSIQGDRVVGDAAHSLTQLFGHDVLLPSGPFILAQIAEAPIFPLFMVRLGYRRYKIIVRDPMVCERDGASREKPSAPVCASGQSCWKRSSVITGTNGLRLSRRF